MNRILMLVVLMLSATSVYAEWTAVGENSDAGTTTYVDFATLQRSGNLVKVWELVDYKTMQKPGYGGYLSAKVQVQLDCQEGKTRILSSTWFSNNMGDGSVVRSSSNPGEENPWEPMQPRSAGETLFKIACDKK